MDPGHGHTHPGRGTCLKQGLSWVRPRSHLRPPETLDTHGVTQSRRRVSRDGVEGPRRTSRTDTTQWTVDRGRSTLGPTVAVLSQPTDPRG